MITFTDDPFHQALDENRERALDWFVHEDGSHTFILPDDDGVAANPRENDGNLTTLIQTNDRYLDIDTDDEGLSEARDHFYGYGQHGTTAPRYGRTSSLDRDDFMVRYIAMFRPDIAYYTGWWSAGNSYGWGYITTARLEENFPEHLVGDRAAYFAKHNLSPEKLFDQEVSIYGQWANGEVYGGVHITQGAPVVVYGAEGAYVDGYKAEEESCWGFLGYDDLADICEQFTSSPITERH